VGSAQCAVRRKTLPGSTVYHRVTVPPWFKKPFAVPGLFHSVPHSLKDYENLKNKKAIHRSEWLGLMKKQKSQG